jgi:hypothetical protein
MNIVSLAKRTALAALSGMSMWPLAYVSEWAGQLGPSFEWLFSYGLAGAIFGALVLVPFVGAKRSRAGRASALILGSILIYALTVELATDRYGSLNLDNDTSILVSGALGAILVGILTTLAAPLRASRKLWAYVVVAGLVGGFLFNLAVYSPHAVVVALGYAAWQVPVCWALYMGSIRDVQRSP